jgi:tetratricopeptide (TPR) repeat protein
MAEEHGSRSAGDLHALGVQLLYESKYEEAVEALTETLTQDPGYGSAYYYRAKAYEALGQTELYKADLAAQVGFTRTRRISPGSSSTKTRVRHPTEANVIPLKERPLLYRGMHRFLPTGREGRSAFLLNLSLIWAGVIVIAWFGDRMTSPYGPVSFLESLGTFMIFPAILLTYFQMVKRLHDNGRSAWHLLAFVIPGWNLFELSKLIFREGDEVRNEYDQ